MKKPINYIFIQALLLILFIISFPNLTFATELNNKYGIHLAQPHFEDIKATADLVNSSGGKWGYITLVIQENDRNQEKWQEIFDQLRDLHLIPIVRLATKPEGASWRRPQKDEAGGWADFLNSLNWVVKARYIILFNEPNHGSEWGGEVDPENYAEVVAEFINKLKQKNPDFFIMLAGFDASAPSYGETMMDEEIFIKRILNSKFLILNSINGWASHSYPNPGFSGSPWVVGRGTVRTYQWELDLLRQFGVSKQLPVFITETGWIRGDEGTVANNLKYAFESIWLLDNRIVAITPFILNYQSEPFLNFSWKKLNSQEFYQQYYMIQSLNKIGGEPNILEKGELTFDFPTELVAYSNFNFKLKIKNFGQAIWDKDDEYILKLENFSAGQYFFSDLKKIRPKQEAEVDLNIKTNNLLGKTKSMIVLYKKDKKVAETVPWVFQVFPLPSLEFKVTFFPKIRTEGKDFEIQIFDKKEKLVFQRKGLMVKKGKGTLTDIQNITLNQPYRLVILKPYYLPRQTIITFKKDINAITFKKMLPLDFNKDGKFNFYDIGELFKKPKLFKLLLP